MHRVLTEPSLADALSRRGIERAGQLSWAHTAELTAEIYREVLAAQSR
jgi:hypothetical protein